MHAAKPGGSTLHDDGSLVDVHDDVHDDAHDDASLLVDVNPTHDQHHHNDSQHHGQRHGEPRWTCAAGGKAWRAAFVLWLDLVGSCKAVRGMSNAPHIRTAVALHISDSDTAVQVAAIQCLRVFKVPYVSPYSEQLLKFANAKTLRGALATFDLTGQHGDGLAAQHRHGVWCCEIVSVTRGCCCRWVVRVLHGCCGVQYG